MMVIAITKSHHCMNRMLWITLMISMMQLTAHPLMCTPPCWKTPVLLCLDLLLSRDPQLYLALPVSFLKIACLHVSFTAYENFYKLSKMHCLLIWFSTFLPSEVSENRDPTIKHISTYTLISSSINTYVIDLFLVILSTY